MQPTPSTADHEYDALVGEIQALFSWSLSVRVESAHANLLESGVLDSVNLVRLLLSLEDYFGCSLPMDELEIESLNSVARIADLVSTFRRRNGGGRP